MVQLDPDAIAALMLDEPPTYEEGFETGFDDGAVDGVDDGRSTHDNPYSASIEPEARRGYNDGFKAATRQERDATARHAWNAMQLDTPSLANCSDYGTGEGQFHGRM